MSAELSAAQLSAIELRAAKRLRRLEASIAAAAEQVEREGYKALAARLRALLEYEQEGNEP